MPDQNSRTKIIFLTLKWLLVPLGMLHWAAVWLRNRCYDWGICRSRRLAVPVISIGNIQMGGTGKTPLVITLLDWLRREGIVAGVLTRGYGRQAGAPLMLGAMEGASGNADPARLGDEPALFLPHLPPGGALGVGADRHAVGSQLLRAYPLSLLLLDDGFQHRKLQRDLDICLIDVSRWAVHPFLFPFSYLRDIKGSLRRAHAIILTKGDDAATARLQAQLQEKYRIPVWRGRYEAAGLEALADGRAVEPDELSDRKFGAVCGIANPAHFMAQLSALGIAPLYQHFFPDHHHYTLQDLRLVFAEAAAAGAAQVIVTTKDAVKLRKIAPPEVAGKLLVLNIRFRIDPAGALEALLRARFFESTD